MDRWAYQADLRDVKKFSIPFYSRVLEYIGVLDSEEREEILNYEFRYAKSHLEWYFHFAEVHYARVMLTRVFTKNLTKDEELELHASLSFVLGYADKHYLAERVEGAPFVETRWRTIGKLLRCSLNIPISKRSGGDAFA